MHPVTIVRVCPALPMAFPRDATRCEMHVVYRESACDRAVIIGATRIDRKRADNVRLLADGNARRNANCIWENSASRKRQRRILEKSTEIFRSREVEWNDRYLLLSLSENYKHTVNNFLLKLQAKCLKF